MGPMHMLLQPGQVCNEIVSVGQAAEALPAAAQQCGTDDASYMLLNLTPNMELLECRDAPVDTVDT